MNSELMLKDRGKSASNAQRVSGELSIQCGLLPSQPEEIVPHVTKILQNFWLILEIAIIR